KPGPRAGTAACQADGEPPCSLSQGSSAMPVGCRVAGSWNCLAGCQSAVREPAPIVPPSVLPQQVVRCLRRSNCNATPSGPKGDTSACYDIVGRRSGNRLRGPQGGSRRELAPSSSPEH